MKVDELLERNILTPPFSCVSVKPVDGSLQRLISGDVHFLYAKGHTRYMDDSDGMLDVNEYMKATGCAQCEIISTNDISMLLAFLKLAEGARPADGKHIIQLDDLKSTCYRYGLPMYQMPYVAEKGRLIGFSIERFTERLDNLYICYALWKALQVRDDDLIRKIQPHALTDDEMQIEIEHRLKAKITVGIIFKDGQPSIYYQAENIMALVEAQLAVLASKGSEYLDGGCIAYCTDCGKPFIKYRKNSTLCEDCKGNTGKSRRYRAKKKGDQNNG